LKLKRELGSQTPFVSQRLDFFNSVFEAWAPLGLVVHIAPTNAFTVGVLSVVEGLLTGNLNFLKTSSKDSLFPQVFLAALANEDLSGSIGRFIIAARISSRRSDQLAQIFAQADGVAAWGGEESVAAVKALTPTGARFVDWGPKISFAYVAKSSKHSEVAAEAIAYDICIADQQACSSPQCVFLETASPDELRAFALLLAEALNRISPTVVAKQPDLQEQAEVTNVTELARLGSCLEENDVIEAKDGSWRILIEYKSGLRASPLFRTVWLKPMPRQNIVTTLRPLRQYLQTVGLCGDPREIADLSESLIAAGVLRITPAGKMHASYMGEPHDGRYALQAYARRVSWQLDSRFDGFASLNDLSPGQPQFGSCGPIMKKENFQALKVDDEFAHLFFKSGGSSGEPKISVFTYDDYHGQMFAAAEGLYAAGLRPSSDRCINLFFGGGLYGGFISFFTILEHLGAVQLPMASHLDFNFVTDMIIRHRVNTVLGMPSYIMQLFQAKAEQLRAYGGIEKVFYGGEHISEVQRRFLMEEFGIKQVTSATYGSVDAGPLGFQCQHCTGTVHHLHSRLQYLEIVALNEDTPVASGEAGRLIFTSRMRHGQDITRYEIGDLGRWLDGPCACGRPLPRFELLGRYGDIARIGTTFVNYSKICKIIAESCGYAGEVQLVLDHSGDRERIRLRLEHIVGRSAEEVTRLIVGAYADLREVVEENLLAVEVEFCAATHLERTPGSGKLRHIIDRR
jgi:phenylacetate-coenzyme A ligase PaaK-like adenylate-forming protein